MQFKTLADRAEWALKLVASNEPMAYDTETSGLDWKRNWPIGYVFTAMDGTSVYIPVRHGGGGNLRGCAALTSPEGPFELHPFEKALAKAFDVRRSKGGLTIGHNLKFDWHFSMNAGIQLPDPLYCTQYGAALLDEFATSYSLEHSAAVRGLPGKKGEAMYAHLGKMFGVPPHRDLMGRFWELPGDDHVAVDYAEGDGVTTLELWKSQQPDLVAQRLELVTRMEMDLLRHVAMIERRGIRVDMSRIEGLEVEFKAKMEKAMEDLPLGFNSRAPTQMVELFTKAGITDWPKTELGNPSFKEKWLLKSDLGRSIVAVRKIRTILDQFIEPMRNTHVFNSRVHANLNQLRGDRMQGSGVEGVGPGRFSCSNPNLQQVPKHNKELAELYRSLFVADEGYDFWEGDYSQCEPRLFAHFARVPILVKGYNNGTLDMHDATAQMLEVDRDTVAKRMNMGLLTGMWPKSFAAHMGWEYKHALAMFKAYFRVYPEIKDFQDDVTAVFEETGFVKTVLGRRCRLESPRFAYQGTSRVIQGSNADILKWMLLKACQMSEGSDDLKILLTVHDSFNWIAKKGRRGMDASRAMVHAISDVQCPPFNMRVPFVMDVKKGDTWSEATFGPKIKFTEAA